MVVLKWWLSVLYFVFVLYIMTVFQIYTEQRQYYHLKRKNINYDIAISDIVHDNYVLSDKTWLCDALVFSCLFITITYILLSRKRKKRISKLFFTLATLYFIRCFTIISTIMPNPNPDCIIDTSLFENWFFGAFRILSGKTCTCTDEVFSGHSLNVLSCLAVWILYCRKPFVIVFCIIYGACTLSIIAVTRYHYTVDVVVALIITFLFHCIYYKKEIDYLFKLYG